MDLIGLLVSWAGRIVFPTIVGTRISLRCCQYSPLLFWLKIKICKEFRLTYTKGLWKQGLESTSQTLRSIFSLPTCDGNNSFWSCLVHSPPNSVAHSGLYRTIFSHNMALVINKIRKEIWINLYTEKDLFQNSSLWAFIIRIFFFNARVTTCGEGAFICIRFPVLIFGEKFYKLIILLL